MRQRLALALIAFALALASASRAADDSSPLTGVEKTAHFEIRFRPGSRAAASIDRAAVMAERDLARICDLLKIKLAGKFVLSLYDDVAELAATTKTQGNAGFSAGNESHIPYDNDQTRFHEMVHIVAAQLLAKSGDESRSLFAAEGLANALLEFVHGVHVHAVAKWFDQQGKLPPLAEMTGAPDFYVWLRAHPDLNAYDIAASLYRWLIDTYGIERVVRYYTGTSAKAAFGIGIDELDKAWRKTLAAYKLRPEVASLLAARYGGPGGSITELLAQGNGWTQLVATVGPGDWTRDSGALTGTSRTGEWLICELGLETYSDCIFRAHVKTASPCALQLRLGPRNCAMLVNGTFVYRSGAPVKSVPTPRMEASRKETDFVLVRRGGVLEVWIDGVMALSCEASNELAPVGIGVCGGTAVFDDIRVRPLK